MVEPEPKDDRALINALRGGHDGAPGWLVSQFHGVVHGLCLRMMGHRHDAEDVVQETFIRVIRGVRGFDDQRPLRPWILGIAANRCRTALRRRTRLPLLQESGVEVADHRSGVSDPEDLSGELSRALALLRPEYRTVFALFHEQALPYEEISVVMDRPVGTIKTWLHRARLEMAEHLTRRGVQC